MIVLVSLLFLCSAFCSAPDFAPMAAGERKANKDGDVLVAYDRAGKQGYLPGVQLSLKPRQKTLSQLSITNCLEFVDAKFDESRGELAVVFVDGMNLVYQRYGSTNGHWQLDQAVDVMEYGIHFVANGIRLELQDLTTIRASFKKNGETEIGRQAGVEKQGDLVYLIRITQEGKVMINDRERRSMQWHPAARSVEH
jgi:hypothetical protein